MALGTAMALVPAGAAVAAEANTTTRVSTGYDGSQADGGSNAPSVSHDGRWLVYSSTATNLVPGDTTQLLDVFLYDRTTGTTELVSRGLAGTPANGRSTDERISANGRFVAFTSAASNLVADDTDGESNVFVWDRTSTTITRLPGKNSLWPDISADGRYVTYSSYAALVPGDADDGIDVYLLDRRTGRTSLISRNGDGSASGGFASVISDNGRYVAFEESSGSRGAKLFDRRTGKSTPITDSATALAISGDGAFVIPLK